MIVHNNTKGIHAYGVGKENLVLKVGKNPDVDEALWAKAKERHEGLRSMIHDKLIVAVEPKVEAKPAKASKSVDVDVKTGK